MGSKGTASLKTEPGFKSLHGRHSVCQSKPSAPARPHAVVLRTPSADAATVTADQLAEAQGIAEIVCVQNNYNLVHRADDSDVSQGLIEYTANLIAELRTGAEGQEGLGAFLEKRPPNWKPNRN